MSETLSCPTCQAITSAEFNFCRHCKNQTKCLNKECGQILLAGEPLCLYCGEPLKASYYQMFPTTSAPPASPQDEGFEEQEFIFVAAPLNMAKK